MDSQGTVATNFHVMEGAIDGTVSFNDEAKSSYKIRGYRGIRPEWDLVLIATDMPPGRHPPLALCEKPSKAARVMAFGAPRGLSFSVSDGLVSAIRLMSEIAEEFPEAQEDMGYAMDSTWIQTTAPISSGNSGGPLVNLHGEVVGINTFNIVVGQNLNFAVAATHIRALLSTNSKTVLALESAPRRPPRAVPSKPKEPKEKLDQSLFGKIKLPNGKEFTDLMAVYSSKQIKGLYEKEDSKFPPFMTKHVNDQLSGVFSWHIDGKLHGWCATFYEAGNPQTVGSYEMGKLNGILRSWDEQGHRLLWIAYKNDKKHGLAVLFKDSKPHLIQDCEKGKVQESYIVTYPAGVPMVVVARQSDEGTAAEQRLAELEAKMDAGEMELRRQFSKWYREGMEEIRRKNVVANAPARRQAIRDRQAADAARHRALWEEHWRRAGAGL